MLFGGAIDVAKPVTSNPTVKAKTLLADLRARPGRAVDRVLIGQQLLSYEYGSRTDPTKWYGDWLRMKRKGLPLPEVMGAELSDLMTYAGFSPNQAAIDELVRHGRAGHPVTLVWHPDNPTGGAFGTPISTTAMQRMLDGDTITGKKWQIQLDRAAAVLKIFSDQTCRCCSGRCTSRTAPSSGGVTTARPARRSGRGKRPTWRSGATW